MLWKAVFDDGHIIRRSGVILNALQGRTGLQTLNLDFKETKLAVHFDSGRVVVGGQTVITLPISKAVTLRPIAHSSWKASCGIGQVVPQKKKLVCVTIGIEAEFEDRSRGLATVDVFDDGSYRANPIKYERPQ